MNSIFTAAKQNHNEVTINYQGYFDTIFMQIFHRVLQMKLLVSVLVL